MSIFGLFQNPDWTDFKRFPDPVQRDIASLLVLDSLAKFSISRELEKASKSNVTGPNTSNSVARASNALAEGLRNNKLLAGELQICLLATGVGKVFSTISWNSLPPERVIESLGLLAMVEFRNHDKLEGDGNLNQSGYSADPDEARTQYLVLAANTIGGIDMRGISKYTEDRFYSSWCLLRSDLFDTNLRQHGSSPAAFSKNIKNLFHSMSPARRQLVLGVAEALAKKETEKTKKRETVKEAAQFDAVKYKQEHPLLYVPFPKLVSLIERVASDIKTTFGKLSINEYELRRLVGAKDYFPSFMLEELLEADTNVLSYAIVGAVAGSKDEKFIGSGVWRKATESFQKKFLLDFQLMAESQANGMLGDAKKEIKLTDKTDYSLGINQLQICRNAPGKFLGITPLHRQEHLSLLFAGTTILRHVLNHPQHGQALASMTLKLIAALDPLITELTKGELMNWEQQKDLPV